MNAITTPDAAAECLVAAAQYCEALEAVVEMAPGAWFVHFETGGECLVEWAEEPNRLVITAGVGEPDPKARAELHASCLTFNALWSTLGAMRLAKDDDSDQLLLVNDVACDSENPHVQLANNLLRHEGLRLFWTLLVENATGEQDGKDGISRTMELLSMQRA